jgi:predicted O-methyltransferase YrrM
MPADELMLLCRIVRYRNPSVIFEIGTYLGGTTLQLTANSQALVYTLDLPPRDHPDYMKPEIDDPELDVYPDQPGIRFIETSYKSRIHQLFGDSVSFDFRPYWGKMDLVFVDGSHHPEFVLSDSRNALKMISSKGIVVWHDYASYAPGVVEVLENIAKTIPLKHIAGTSLVVHEP